MLVFEVLDDIVEIIHTGPGYWVNTQEFKQAGEKGEKYWGENQKLVRVHFYITNIIRKTKENIHTYYKNHHKIEFKDLL